MLKEPNNHQRYDWENAQHFCVDYDPLEYLLVCIMDGIEVRDDQNRKTRLRKAYVTLTGRDRERVDSPDSTVARALIEYMRQDEINRDNQLIPEEGGPVIKTKADERRFREKTANGLAMEAARTVDDLGGNLPGYVYSRIMGTYRNKLLRSDLEGFKSAQYARFHLYDGKKEQELFDDMKRIADIMAKHGVKLDPTRPFWRCKS